MTAAARIFAVDPARLASGRWCHRADKLIGQGDIHASYSADRIGMGKPVRRPFAWHGGLWVCTAICTRAGETTHEAYRLVHPAAFDGDPVSYGARVRALHDGSPRPERGFYHGMIVKHGGKQFVLSGPAVSFVPGQSEQLALF